MMIKAGRINLAPIKLGKTEAQVSPICLGTMYFGSKLDEDSAFQLLDMFVESGGTFIDTANFYARWMRMCVGGESEMMVGRWMRRRSRRGRMFIATKVGFDYPGVEKGLSANQIINECNRSLKRLDIETIDLFYANYDDRITPLEETLKAFDKLIQDGKIRFMGASNYVAWRLEEARWLNQTNKTNGFCCVQQRHTFLRPCLSNEPGGQISTNEEVIDYCQQRNLSLLAYSPLLNGSYTRPDRSVPDSYVSQENERRIVIIKVMAQQLKVTANQLILAWMMQQTPPIIPVIAASAPSHLEENIRSASLEFEPHQLERLNNAWRNKIGSDTVPFIDLIRR